MAKIRTAEAVELCCGKQGKAVWVASSQTDTSAHFPVCLASGWAVALSVGFLPPPCGRDHLRRISFRRAARLLPGVNGKGGNVTTLPEAPN